MEDMELLNTILSVIFFIATPALFLKSASSDEEYYSVMFYISLIGFTTTTLIGIFHFETYISL
ncbi:hypothetical protein AB3M95_21290 [Metabacillus niabensis]